MSAQPQVFTMVRLPVEFGPILVCRGEITAATVIALRAEFETLELLGHRVVTMHLMIRTLEQLPRPPAEGRPASSR